MDCSPPGSSVRGIFQARILECVAISHSRRPSRPLDWTHTSCVGRWILYHWATREVLGLVHIGGHLNASLVFRFLLQLQEMLAVAFRGRKKWLLLRKVTHSKSCKHNSHCSESLLLPAIVLIGCTCASLAIKHGRIIFGKGRLPFHLFDVHSTVRWKVNSSERKFWKAD